MMNPIAYHGLVAYSSKKSLLGLGKAAKVCERGAEICVSDRPIGPVGITIQGEITALYNRDCYSKLDENGKRYATADHAEQLATPNSHDDYVATVAAVAEWVSEYTEAFMIGHLIREVWVKEWAQDYHRNAELIARVLRVPLRWIPDGSERIWEAHPVQDTAETRFDEYQFLENII